MLAAKGFAATIRAIGDRAMLTQQLLFTATVLYPFHEFVEERLNTWQAVLATRICAAKFSPASDVGGCHYRSNMDARIPGSGGGLRL
jgi:hypothetical protein